METQHSLCCWLGVRTASPYFFPSSRLEYGPGRTMWSWLCFKTQTMDRTLDRVVLWETPGWLQVKVRPENEDYPPGDSVTDGPWPPAIPSPRTCGCESVGRHCLNSQAPCEGCRDEEAVCSWGPLTFRWSPGGSALQRKWCRAPIHHAGQRGTSEEQRAYTIYSAISHKSSRIF